MHNIRLVCTIEFRCSLSEYILVEKRKTEIQNQLEMPAYQRWQDAEEEKNIITICHGSVLYHTIAQTVLVQQNNLH